MHLDLKKQIKEHQLEDGDQNFADIKYELITKEKVAPSIVSYKQKVFLKLY